MAYAFGRRPHDPAVVARLPSLAGHRMGAFLPETTLDRRSVEFVPGLYENNLLPTCTAAGLANHAAGVAAINGFRLPVSDADVPAFYAACCGCAPTVTAMAATDGAVMADVLARQIGAGFSTIEGVPLVARYGTIPLARTTLANAACRLGGAYLGVRLHDRDMQNVGHVWDVVPGRDDGPVVGGHCIVGPWDYTGLADDDTVRLMSWGAFPNATWAWLLARIDEAYGLAWGYPRMPVDTGVDADRLAGAPWLR